MDRLVVGWSAGCHVDHPCGWQISPWPVRKVTEDSRDLKEILGVPICGTSPENAFSTYQGN